MQGEVDLDFSLQMTAFFVKYPKTAARDFWGYWYI